MKRREGRGHIYRRQPWRGKRRAFNSLKLTDYLEEEDRRGKERGGRRGKGREEGNEKEGQGGVGGLFLKDRNVKGRGGRRKEGRSLPYQ